MKKKEESKQFVRPILLVVLDSPTESLECLFDLVGLGPGHFLQIIRYRARRNAENIL